MKSKNTVFRSVLSRQEKLAILAYFPTKQAADAFTAIISRAKRTRKSVIVSIGEREGKRLIPYLYKCRELILELCKKIRIILTFTSDTVEATTFTRRKLNQAI